MANEDLFERHDGYMISCDRNQLDRDAILGFLETSYWARHRSRELNWQAIEGSFVFGLYADNGASAGFARVISDLAKFAWIGDLFILPPHRDKGLSKWMMDVILNQSRFRAIPAWQLSTDDAQGLYEQFGFEVFEGQGKFMTLNRKIEP